MTPASRALLAAIPIQMMLVSQALDELVADLSQLHCDGVEGALRVALTMTRIQRALDRAAGRLATALLAEEPPASTFDSEASAEETPQQGPSSRPERAPEPPRGLRNGDEVS
jgi:hypothetical protein